MSQATFNVTLKTPVTDMTTLLSIADEIKDELSAAGMEVVEVSPWARPSDSSAVPGGQPPSMGLPTQPGF